MGTETKGFDAKLANGPLLIFDFLAPWRLALRIERQSQSTRNSKLTSTAWQSLSCSPRSIAATPYSVQVKQNRVVIAPENSVLIPATSSSGAA